MHTPPDLDHSFWNESVPLIGFSTRRSPFSSTTKMYVFTWIIAKNKLNNIVYTSVRHAEIEKGQRKMAFYISFWCGCCCHLNDVRAFLCYLYTNTNLPELLPFGILAAHGKHIKSSLSWLNIMLGYLTMCEQFWAYKITAERKMNVKMCPLTKCIGLVSP